ncbi:Bromodomain-containing protein 1 [Yarrowia sp. B02]|nr:Bromodomain-containing protein 1 [Yarrowia sp. B02]
MTSLANLIYAQTLYKYAVDNSVNAVAVSPDIPQPIAEYMALQVPKHPLVKTDILSAMGASPSLTAAQCQTWWRQMIASTKIAETELPLGSLAKLVDGFRQVLYKETVAGLKEDEIKYKHLTEEMAREEKEKAEKERAEKQKLEQERVEKEKLEKEQHAKPEEDVTEKPEEETSEPAQPPKSDDDDVDMVDAVEELKEDNPEEKEAVQEEAETEPVKVKEEEKEAEVATEDKDAEAAADDQEEEDAGAQADAESEAQAEESESEKETTADAETDRGETEEPDESELDRVTETPEAGATPGSEERTRKRARSTTEESDTRKRSRRNTSAAPSANRKFQNVAGNLLSNISSNKSASFFTHPVNPNSAPNYYALIFSPTDIRTIKAQVKDGRISSTSELEREVAKMFANAIMYNPWDSDVNLWAREMQQETDALLTLFRGAGGE